MAQFTFKSEPTYSAKELKDFPWLKGGTRVYLYEVEDVMGRGMKGIAYKCVPLSGKKSFAKIPVVVKVINTTLDDEYYDRDSVTWRQEIIEQAYNEWLHVRKRLEGCEFANPIFDIDYVSPNDHDGPQVRTVQRLIRHGDPLDKAFTSRRRGVTLSFKGIERWDEWQQTSLAIAEAVREFHRRRVTHGDLHPGNIFLTEAEDPYAEDYVQGKVRAILIDYGEAFLEPSDDERHQGSHSYRAPERGTPLYVPTEYVDVYSFGMVLCYLATGGAEAGAFSRFHHGHERREHIRKLLEDGNPILFKENPAVLDIIFSCTAYDPSARPSMSHVVRWLSDAGEKERPKLTFSGIADRLNSLVQPFSDSFSVSGELPSTLPDNEQSVFLRLIDSKIDEIESILACPSEQIEIGGTRDDLIDHLQSLLGMLGPGDSWTALTTPDVWQNRALGLDGRYATATINAVQRLASVRRFFVFSIEEFGEEWSQRLADALKSGSSQNMRTLGGKIEDCCHVYRRDPNYTEIEDFIKSSKEYRRMYRDRFTLVVRSLDNMIRTFSLGDKLKGTQEYSLRKMEGLVIGFLPVATRKTVQDKRVHNPACLMRFDPDGGEPEKWLLVMTDMRGRIMQTMPEPHLLGLRVYKSVFSPKAPKDKIKRYEEIAKESVIVTAEDVYAFSEALSYISSKT